jgi:hypothetical protein
MNLKCNSAPENKMFREGNLYDAELASEGRQLRVTDDLGHIRIIPADSLRFIVNHTDRRSAMLESANYARFTMTEEDGNTYSVYRFYSDERNRELVKEDLTREEAKEYCSEEETEGILPDGTKWFCGFIQD